MCSAGACPPLSFARRSISVALDTHLLPDSAGLKPETPRAKSQHLLAIHVKETTPALLPRYRYIPHRRKSGFALQAHTAQT